MSPILLAFLGTMFTFLATALGAATVFFFKKDIPHGMQRAFLGFAAGVMIAASVWSLLIPAMEMAREQGSPEWLPARPAALCWARRSYCCWTGCSPTCIPAATSRRALKALLPEPPCWCLR